MNAIAPAYRSAALELRDGALTVNGWTLLGPSVDLHAQLGPAFLSLELTPEQARTLAADLTAAADAVQQVAA